MVAFSLARPYKTPVVLLLDDRFPWIYTRMSEERCNAEKVAHKAVNDRNSPDDASNVDNNEETKYVNQFTQFQRQKHSTRTGLEPALLSERHEESIKFECRALTTRPSDLLFCFFAYINRISITPSRDLSHAWRSMAQYKVSNHVGSAP
jgi:hypothetical protein